MRTTLLAILALLLLAAPAQARRARCDVRPGATIVADATYRVYVTVIPSAQDPDANRTTISSCRVDTRARSKRLDRYRNTLDGSLSPRSGVIAGRWVLLDVEEATGTDDGHHVYVWDLKTGYRIAGALYVAGADTFEYALATTGGFAVRLRDGSVHAYDEAGDFLLTPAGSDLAAVGKRVYWTTPDGKPGSSTLGGPLKKQIEVG